jgi:hypothetical protein
MFVYIYYPESLFYFQYTYTPASGAWEHRSGFQLAQSSLEDITYKSGKMQYYVKRNDPSPARGDKNLPVSIL